MGSTCQPLGTSQDVLRASNCAPRLQPNRLFLVCVFRIFRGKKREISEVLFVVIKRSFQAQHTN